MHQPLVSILIPAKDESDYIADCLDSILKQTYSNWEAIIVDDFSKDDTLDIIQLYSKKDKRFYGYSNTDAGIIPALRLAFAECKGALITRMDADDLMSPDKLSLLVNKLEEKGPGYIATAQVRYFSESELGNGYIAYEQWLNKLCLSNTQYDELYKECPIPSPNWMMYRSDLTKVGAFDSLIYPEDYDLIFRCYEWGIKPSSITKVLHHWRDYPIRSSRTQDHYSDNSFLKLKMTYFLKLEWNKNAELILWGAAKRGKKIAQILIAQGISFRWICNNKNKHGHDVYGVKIEDINEELFGIKSKIIVAVAEKIGQQEIVKKLRSKSLKLGSEYYLFC